MGYNRLASKYFYALVSFYYEDHNEQIGSKIGDKYTYNIYIYLFHMSEENVIQNVFHIYSVIQFRFLKNLVQNVPWKNLKHDG